MSSLRPSKDVMMMSLAVMISRMSTCKRLQVGSVITDERYEQIAIGYNGTYRGGPNECLRPVEGSCGCIHSEINALIKLKFRPDEMFVTDSPCEACAAAIVNAGVQRLFFAREYRRTEGVELLEAAKIPIGAIQPDVLSHMMFKHFGLQIDMPPFNWRITTPYAHLSE